MSKIPEVSICVVKKLCNKHTLAPIPPVAMPLHFLEVCGVIAIEPLRAGDNDDEATLNPKH